MAPDPTDPPDGPDRPDEPGPTGDKAAWRRHQRRRRRDRSAAERAWAADAAAAGLPALLDAVLPGDPTGVPVALHVPVGTEPGAAPDGTAPLLDAAVALGLRVLLPVTVGGAPLDWAAYRDDRDLTPGPHGLREPAGPRLGPDAGATAALVVLPALAVDATGVRLGRGGGHYDRTLDRTGDGSPGGTRVALVFDDEVVARLPAEPHDVPVDVLWRAVAGPVAVRPPR